MHIPIARNEKTRTQSKWRKDKERSYVHQNKETNSFFNVCVRIFSRPTPPKSWGAFTKILQGSLSRTKEVDWK